MSIRFAHLHVHTDASRIDGLGTVDRLVTAAANVGFKHLAMTDHGSLANAISFTLACHEAGIKPILGMEGYVAVDGQVCHITLLADGNEGFSSLVKLNNIGQASEYGRPAFEFDDLIAHNKGLLCLTGCAASPFHAMDYPEAKRLAVRLKSAFGPRLFAEAMFVSDVPNWDRVERLASDVKLKLVTTNDVHFPHKEDAPLHTVLTSLKAAFTYQSKHLYLATPDQIEGRIYDSPDGLRVARAGFENAFRIAERLSVVSFSSKPSLPHFESAMSQLTYKVYQGLEAMGLSKEYWDRAEYELKTIETMGFETYFLILEDLTSHARSVGVRVGAGRGSGVGSLLLYLLGITEIDPILYGLSFERFLNLNRREMPDVDMDFDSEGRQLVIDYAKSKYGAWPVATYSRYKHATLVHDLSKYFRLPRHLETQAADEGPDSEAFQQLARKARDFEPAYRAMEDQIRHIGQHAGGIVITDAEVPLERTSDKSLVAAWTEGGRKELSKAGIVKYDILGLTSLSILKELEEGLGVQAPEPTDGHPAFKLFRDGNLSGIFQFSGSDGILRFTQEVAPNSFKDLIAINALYRPGSLDAGTAKHYPKWKRKPRKLHETIDPILKETAGVVVYQEQVMAIYAKIAGGGLADADEARRVISKRRHADPEWEINVARLNHKFMDGAQSLGIPSDTAQRIWDELVAHGRYSFNKSHSTAYAMIAWQMAWFKHEYPAQFYTALLNHDGGNAQKYIFDLLEEGIELKLPHVNKSWTRFRYEDGKIWMPFRQIKFLGETGAETIVKEQPYKSLDDFMERVPRKQVTARARFGLWEIGAFNGVEGDVESLRLTKELEERSELEMQTEVLGFVIPSPKVMATVREAKRKGLTAGIVTARVEKPSRWGDYTVYYLVPQGAVWSRDMRGLEVGQFIRVKVKADSGKILKCEELEL